VSKLGHGTLRSTPSEKKIFADLAMRKPDFRFLHRKAADFRHTSKKNQGGLPKKNPEKKNVFREKGVEVRSFDGT
jgi:hypothetical protein